MSFLFIFVQSSIGFADICKYFIVEFHSLAHEACTNKSRISGKFDISNLVVIGSI